MNCAAHLLRAVVLSSILALGGILVAWWSGWARLCGTACRDDGEAACTDSHRLVTGVR